MWLGGCTTSARGGLPTRSGVHEFARYGVVEAQVGPQEQDYSIIHKSHKKENPRHRRTDGPDSSSMVSSMVL